jgi:hypothetical protein
MRNLSDRNQEFSHHRESEPYYRHYEPHDDESFYGRESRGYQSSYNQPPYGQDYGTGHRRSDYEDINQSRWNPNFDSRHVDPMAYDRDFAYNRSYDTYNSINDRRHTYNNDRWGGREAASGSYGTSGTGFRGKGPKGYERSDERIREEVCDCLADADSIDASSIEVKVDKGEVILSGTVSDRYQKREAEDLIESLRGVKDVHNNLKVQSQAMVASQVRSSNQERKAS